MKSEVRSGYSDATANKNQEEISQNQIIKARRTAFVARFIVLREGKRTKAHRVIELMEWDDLASVESLASRFRQAFIDNGDSMAPVDRDLRRALAHSYRSLKCFIIEYAKRATTDFIGALEDYGRSNELLFTEDEQPRSGGWRLPTELRKAAKLRSARGECEEFQVSSDGEPSNRAL